MRGVLVDANAVGHLRHLLRILRDLDLLPLLESEQVVWVTHHDLGLPADLDDRRLWNFCQEHGWVLLTDNRNRDGADSLEATLRDSWQMGQLPVLTLGSKRRFEAELDYATNVSIDLADLVFGLKRGENRDQPRIYVPRKTKPRKSKR